MESPAGRPESSPPGSSVGPQSWFERRAALRGSVAVVTGGAGGLGRAIVTDLAANGARVAFLDVDADGVENLRATLVASGTECIAVVGDARDPDVMHDLFAGVDEHWARLDTLVNVVGGTFQAPFEQTSAKGWDALLRTNLGTVLQSCSLAVPRMRAGGRGGSIINLTTIEAHRAAPGFAVYSAAKAAVEQFSRTLAVEVAPDGIRVNSVAPDYVPTPKLEQLMEHGPIPDPVLRVAIPMGRAGQAEDVSNCVVFLASALSGFVTGTTLHPDGGTLASSGWFNWPGTGWSNVVPTSVVDLLAEQGRADST